MIVVFIGGGIIMKKSIEEYEKEMEVLKTKIENTANLLENQSSALVDKSIEFLKDRIKYEIESCVKNNPARTKELAENGQLKDMKDDMNQLLEEVSQKTIAAMSEDKVFIHRSIQQDRNKSTYEYKGIIEKKYKEAYQIVVGFAGEILNKYGYIKVGNDYNSCSTWKYISGSGGKIKYGYSFDMRQIEDDWKKYTDSLMSYYEDLLKYYSLIKSKEESEAMNLWDSI